MIIQRRYLTRIIFICLLLNCLYISYIYGNSAPILIEESPSFSIAPIDNSPIEVLNEYLEFDMTIENGRVAKVRASYDMMNTSDERLKQSMIFPFITSPNDGFIKGVNISTNGKPVDFNVVRLGSLPDTDFKSLRYIEDSSQEINEFIEIDNIITMINESKELTIRNFKKDDIVKVYTLHLPMMDEPYKSEVSFESFNLDKQNILYYNFNSFSLNNEGRVQLGTWSSAKISSSPRDKAFIAILGSMDENKETIHSITNNVITSEERKLEDFLNEIISINLEELRHYENNIDIHTYDNYKEDLLNHIYMQIDIRFDRKEPFFSLDSDGISTFNYEPYLGAFIYSVPFEPNSIVSLIVEYNMQATIDRRFTSEFSNMFLYLLNPASKWKGFGELIINVIPNENYPYIIASSLPLQKDERTGIYTGTFNELPDNDFYFVTYKTGKPEPLVLRKFRAFPYIAYMISPIIIVLVFILMILYFAKNLRKNNNNIK